MNNISDNVMNELESRSLAPTPRWRFLATRTAFWLLAVVSVLVGSIAVAIADFVFFDNDSMASLRDAPIQDIAQSIPFIWLLVLALFTACAYFGFRKTKRGYRYATVVVILAAVALSLVLGIALNAFDFGQYAHKYLLSHTSFYDGLIHSSEDTAD